MPTTIRLRAQRTRGTGTISAFGQITATSVPFSEDGDDTLGLGVAPAEGGNAN